MSFKKEKNILISHFYELYFFITSYKFEFQVVDNFESIGSRQIIVFGIDMSI